MYVGKKIDLGFSVPFAWAVLAIALVVGCSPGIDEKANFANCNSEAPEITIQRQANYDATLRKIINTPGNRCTECHDGKSKRAPYPHASEDLSQAYNAATALVDLNNPATSSMVSKIQKSHNCGDAAKCQALAAAMLASITEWSQLESKLPPLPQCNLSLRSGVTLTLDGQELKAAGLSTSVPKAYRWDLTGMHPEILGKVHFSIDVTHFVDAGPANKGSFRISNPVLATDTGRLRVMSVIPTLDGKLTKYANYANVDFVLPPMAFDPSSTIWGFRPLSSSRMVMEYTNPATTGEKLGFTILLKDGLDDAASVTTKMPGCKAPAEFKAVYDNVMNLQVLINNVGYRGQCTRCHGDSTAAAFAVMNLSNNGVDACLEVLSRVNLADPWSSTVLKKPSKADETACQGGGHPVEFRFLANCAGTAADPTLAPSLSLIMTWINKERALQQ